MADDGKARVGIISEGRGNQLHGAREGLLRGAARRTRDRLAAEARIGIAGLDENLRLEQAHRALGRDGHGPRDGHDGEDPQAAFGVGGLNCHQVIAAGESARFGVSGLDRPAKCAVAGVNTRQIQEASLGVAGNTGRRTRQGLADTAALRRRDAELAAISAGSNRLGDRAARESWQHGVWFADYTYVVKGGSPASCPPGVAWRHGRQSVFGREHRELPLYLDSAGYRRLITGTAPAWSHRFDTYPAAIEIVDPDGYAWYDDPRDRVRTLADGRRLMSIFPADVASGRQWPVFSARWTWRDDAHLLAGALPGWASAELANLIPLSRTQRRFKRDTLEKWARLAIANALLAAGDPDFHWMIDTFGRVMLGGLVGSRCPRMARHLYLATLYHACPGVQFWGLGQASACVVNGLGMLGLLDRVWVDGTWWLLDATADRFAVVENGLITMISFEGWAYSLFTLVEAMAANLRSLLAAYAGLWSWPPPEPLPLDLLDPDQAADMKRRLAANATQLHLF